MQRHRIFRLPMHTPGTLGSIHGCTRMCSFIVPFRNNSWLHQRWAVNWSHSYKNAGTCEIRCYLQKLRAIS